MTDMTNISTTNRLIDPMGNWDDYLTYTKATVCDWSMKDLKKMLREIEINTLPNTDTFTDLKEAIQGEIDLRNNKH